MAEDPGKPTAPSSWHPKVAEASKSKVLEPSKSVVDNTVTELRVSEVLNAFVRSLNRLSLVTERINGFCDDADSELETKPNQH